MVDHFQIFSLLNFSYDAHYNFQTEDLWGVVTNYDDYLLLALWGWNECDNVINYLIDKSGLKLVKARQV